MSYSLSTVIAKSLPAFSGSAVTYNAETNTFLSQGWTSMAGNMYYQAARISEQLIICMQIGQGYCRTFLNGIRIFGFDGKTPRLIADKLFSCHFYSDYVATEDCTEMLADYLCSQAKLAGCPADKNACLEYARTLVNETKTKRLR